MNEKHESPLFITVLLFVGFIGILFGYTGSGFIAGKLYRNAPSGEIANLNQRIDYINREYTERQRIIKEQQRIIGNDLEQCIRYVEVAGDIVERTSSNAGGAINNLKEAIDLIRQGITEREALKMELDNIRTTLYRIRDLVGYDIE